MKTINKLIFIFVVFIGVSSLYGKSNYIKWENLENAKKISKKTNKPIFLMVTYEYCPECRYVKKVVYKDKDIHNIINNKYIPVVYEFNDPKLPKKFKKWGVPRFYFVNSDFQIYSYHFGGVRIKKMQKILDENLKNTKVKK